MKQFFHIDRTGSLKLGDVIELESVSIVSELSGPINHVDELFKYGVSKHGLQYINQKDTPDCITEWLFEFVRRSNFRDKPSRFQSFFAVATLADIKRLQEKMNFNSGTIYRVECDHYFKADMNLVGYQNSPLLISWLANIYWSGRTSEELNKKFSLKPLWEYLLTGRIKIVEKVEL